MYSKLTLYLLSDDIENTSVSKTHLCPLLSPKLQVIGFLLTLPELSTSGSVQHF